MNFGKIVVFTTLLSSYTFSIDFTQLLHHLNENSKQLQFKKYDIDISKEDLNIIKSEDYPTVSIGLNIENSKSLEDSLSSTSVGDNNLIGDSLKKSYGYVNLNYNLYSFGRFDNKKKVQEYQIETSKYEYCLANKDLILKLLDFYNNSLNYQIKTKILEEIIDVKSKIYNSKEKLFSTGNISKLEVTKGAIEVADLYSQISENKKELKNLLNQISLLTNYSFIKNEFLEPLVINKFEEERKFEDTVNAKTILFQIKAKQSEISLQEKEYLPNLNFYSKYDVYGNDKDSYKKSIEEMKEYSYKYGLNLSINIFDGFKTSAQKQKNLLQLKQLQTKYDLEKDNFENQILTINDNYEMDTVDLKNKTQTLELALANSNDSLRLKKIGELGQIEMLNVQIEKKYKELDYKLSKGKLAYEYTKKSILLEDNECIVP